jgi:hypothetical protein
VCVGITTTFRRAKVVERNSLGIDPFRPTAIPSRILSTWPSQQPSDSPFHPHIFQLAKEEEEEVSQRRLVMALDKETHTHA